MADFLALQQNGPVDRPYEMLARGRTASAWRADVPPMVPHIQADAAEQASFSGITAAKETPGRTPASVLTAYQEHPGFGFDVDSLPSWIRIATIYHS